MLTADPLVTVITCFYNRAQLAEQTMDGLVNQSYRNLQIIAVDDGSTDHVSECFEKYAREDSRVEVIKHPNKGFVHSMIDATRLARGEYIAIQGAGDTSLPDRIRKQVEVLSRDPESAAVGCWVRHIDITTQDAHVCEIRDADVSHLLDTSAVYSHGEVMFRKDMFWAVGGYRECFKFSQDYDLWLRLRGIGKMRMIEEILYERTFTTDGIQRNLHKHLLQLMLADFAHCCDEVRRSGNPDPLNADGMHALAFWIPSSFTERRVTALALQAFIDGNQQRWEALFKFLKDNRFRSNRLRLLTCLKHTPCKAMTRSICATLLALKRKLS